MKAAAVLCTLLVLTGLAACEDQSGDRPYIEFAGGGFIFNYNLAEAYYGFVARATRPIPAGTILQAEFENPSGGPPLIVQKVAREGGVEYSFRTPPVEGVKAERDYRVVVKLLEPEGDVQLAAYSKTFRSTADQDILPKKPLTIGPGYQPNPESEYAPSPIGKKESDG